MLIRKDTQLKIDETVSFKISSGEEIIGKVVFFNDTEVVVHKPFQLAATQTGLTLLPFLMMANDNADPTFRLSSIVAIYAPAASFKTAYDSAASDLVLPKTKSIIT
jgi:hypothetical protein